MRTESAPSTTETAVATLDSAAAHVAADARSSSRRALDTAECNSKVARLHEMAQEAKKQIALVTQLSQVRSSSCVLAGSSHGTLC